MEGKHLSHVIHPGVEKENLYPLALNKEKRFAHFYNRFIYSFNSLNFGATVNIQLNSDSLFSDCMISAKFDSNGGVNVLRNLPMARLVNRIELLIGSAQSYVVNGNDIVNILLDGCDSTEKKTECIRLMGGATHTMSSGDEVWYLPLGFLPWSKIGTTGYVDKVPFDSTIMGSQQVRINIYLNPVSAVYSTGTPSALLEGKFYIRTAQIQNPEDKIKVNPNMAINYPFVYYQPYVSQAFTPSSTSQQQNVYLLSFKNAPCTSILLRCVDVSNQVNNAQNLNVMSNIVISLNGQTLYKEDDNSSQALALFNNHLQNNWTYGGNTYYYVSIPISQTFAKNTNYNLDYAHGINLANMQVLLQFTSSSTNLQLVEATYQYNANLLLSGGSQEIIL